MSSEFGKRRHTETCRWACVRVLGGVRAEWAIGGMTPGCTLRFVLWFHSTGKISCNMNAEGVIVPGGLCLRVLWGWGSSGRGFSCYPAGGSVYVCTRVLSCSHWSSNTVLTLSFGVLENIFSGSVDRECRSQRFLGKTTAVDVTSLNLLIPFFFIELLKICTEQLE